MENCTRYDCVETAVGAVILASGVVCPPFNDTECLQVWTSTFNANNDFISPKILFERLFFMSAHQYEVCITLLTYVYTGGFDFSTGAPFNFHLLACRMVV